MEQEQGLKCSICDGYLAPVRIVQDDRVVERMDSRIATVKMSQPIRALLYGSSDYPLSMYACNRCGLAYFFKRNQ